MTSSWFPAHIYHLGKHEQVEDHCQWSESNRARLKKDSMLYTCDYTSCLGANPELSHCTLSTILHLEPGSILSLTQHPMPSLIL